MNLKASFTRACEYKLNESLVFCRGRWEAGTLRSLPLDFYQDEQTNGSVWPTSKEAQEPLGATEIRWKARERPSDSNINWVQIIYLPTPSLLSTREHIHTNTKRAQKANWRCWPSEHTQLKRRSPTPLHNLSARLIASSWGRSQVQPIAPDEQGNLGDLVWFFCVFKSDMAETKARQMDDLIIKSHFAFSVKREEV